MSLDLAIPGRLTDEDRRERVMLSRDPKIVRMAKRLHADDAIVNFNDWEFQHEVRRGYKALGGRYEAETVYTYTAALIIALDKLAKTR